MIDYRVRIENRIYIRGDIKESLGMNIFSPFHFFSSKFHSNIYSILYAGSGGKVGGAKERGWRKMGDGGWLRIKLY